MELPQISYQRSPQGSYMIIRGDPVDRGYEEQMLRENRVRMLLAFYTHEADRQLQIWYEITGKRSLADYVEQEGLDIEKLQRVIGAMSEAFRGTEKYLISPDHLYLTKDTVFFSKEQDQLGAYLCWCPFHLPPVEEQVRAILGFFLQAVEREREEVKRLCRELYDRSLEEVSMDELMEIAARYHGTVSEQACNKTDMSDDISSEPEASPEKDIGYSVNKDEDLHIQKAGKELFPVDSVCHNPSDGNAPDPVDSIISSLIGRIKELLSGFVPVKPQRKPVNPPDEGMIVFEPDQDLHEPTTLMRIDDSESEPGQRFDDREFRGILKYEGGGDEDSFILNKDAFCIGTDEDGNDGILKSPVVSRHHAKIYREESGYYIQDLNSTNGTYVNDKMLSYHDKQLLNRTDRIRFADVTYRIF